VEYDSRRFQEFLRKNGLDQIIVIDTCVFMFDHFVMKKAFRSLIIIPQTVIRELKNLTLHCKASVRRRANRSLKAIFGERLEYELKEGIFISKNKCFVLIRSTQKIYFRQATADNEIISLAVDIEREKAKGKVILFSRDNLLRAKARNKGVDAKPYNKNSFNEIFGKQKEGVAF
jgi:predicted ribonuclease YlaK